MKKLLYLLILSSMFGAGVLSIGVGVFQLSIFRGLLILFMFIFVTDIAARRKTCLYINNYNRYSLAFFGIWLFYSISSILWVKDDAAWMKAVIFIGIGFFCILVLNKYIRDREDVLRSFRVIVPAILFHSLLGWYEVISGHYYFLGERRLAVYLRGGYPVSTFGNSNDFALFMMFSFFILYICMVCSKTIIAKIFFFLVMFSSLTLVFLTKSRACLLGLILGLIFLVLYSIKRKNIRRVLIAILLGILVIALVNTDLILSILPKANEVLVFDFSQQENSEAVRINLLRNGIQFLLSTYGFGTGSGNIEYWMANFANYNTSGVLNIHNWLMEILVGYGWVIFSAYVYFYVRLFMRMRSKYKISEHPTDIAISIGSMSVLVAYLAGSFSSSSNMYTEWLWVFWALLIAYQGIENKEMTVKVEDGEKEGG